MKVVYTEPALGDLAEITSWLKQNYPGLGRAVEGKNELLAVAVLEIAVVEPREIDVAKPRRRSTPFVVVVVRDESMLEEPESE